MNETPGPGDQPRQQSNIPIPDPSLLTTAALREAIDHQKALFDSQLDNIAAEFSRFRDNHAERHRDAVDAAIRQIKELFDQKLIGVADKFAAVQRQFDERDERTRLAFDAADKAVAAALSAAEKAVTAALAAQEKAGAKSEATTAKLIEGLQIQVATSIGALEGQIADIKERMAAGEGRGLGVEKADVSSDRAWALAIAGAGVLVAVAAVILTAIIR